MKSTFTFTAIFLALSLQAQLKPVAYSDGAQKLNGFSIAPKSGSAAKPGILILPAWTGITAHEKEVAEKLSQMGYFAFIADIYGEGHYPKDMSDAGKISGQYKKDYKAYQHRIQLALDALVKAGANPDNVVAIGYCFGGGGVLEMARSDMKVKGVVSFHGSLTKDASRPNEAMTAKVLILHGADDPHSPKADVDALEKELDACKADWQVVLFANAVHAFTDKSAGNDPSKGVAYNEKADKRSWEDMKIFLSEVLKK